MEPEPCSDSVSETGRSPLGPLGRRTAQGWHWPLTWAMLIYVSLCIAFKALAVYSLYLLILYLAYKLLGLGMHGVASVLGRLWQTDSWKRAVKMMFKVFVAAIVIGAAIVAIREWGITTIYLGAILAMSGIHLSWALLARSAIWKRFLRSGFVAGISSFAKAHGFGHPPFWFFAAVACFFFCIAWLDPVCRIVWILFGLSSGYGAAQNRFPSPRLEDLFWNSATNKILTREQLEKNNERVEKARKDLLQILTHEEIEKAKQAVLETIAHEESEKLVQPGKHNEEVEKAKQAALRRWRIEK